MLTNYTGNIINVEKQKKKLYKSKLLHELETLHKDNPKLYWKMINDLQDKSHDSEDNCIPPSRWLKHFQSLNTVQDFPISESEITEAISKIKLNKAPELDNISNNMLKCSQTALLQCYKKYLILV